MKIILNCILALVCMLIFSAEKLSAQSQCEVTHYDEFSGMAQWYVTCSVQDKQGMMWFGTWNGLNRFDGYEFVCFKSRVGDGVEMASDRIENVTMLEDGNLLCIVDGELFVFDVEKCTFSSASEEITENYHKGFSKSHKGTPTSKAADYYSYKDIYGTTWAIYKDGKLARQNNENGDLISYEPSGDQLSNVKNITIDKNNNVWLCSNFGAYKLSFSKTRIQNFDQDSKSLIRCFYVDQKRRYWVTSKEDASVRLFDSNNRLLGYLGQDGRLHSNFTSFTHPIYAVLQDSKGTIWLGSRDNGLYRLVEISDGCFSVANYKSNPDDNYSICNNSIFDIKEDHQGRLWIATFEGGINCIENLSSPIIKFLNSNNDLECSTYRALKGRNIHITADDKMLVATTTGLLVADISPADVRNISFKFHSKDAHRSSSLANNATMYVMEDSKQRIYVCTESGGVNQILSDDLMADQLEFRHFNTSTGLPSDVALSAIPYDDNLLVVSNNQLIILKPDEGGEHNNESFLMKDRLRFSDATPTLLPDGRLIFGLQEGAFTINLSEFQKSSFVPPIALTALSIENGPLDYAVNSLDSIVMDASQRSLALHFAALDYSDNSQILYAYRFGNGGAWTKIGKHHSASFLDLSPGTYCLQIRSTNGDGVWVDNTRYLTIIVTPTFWETGWAKLLYNLLLVALLLAIIATRNYIVRQNRRQKELHEAYLALLNANNSDQKSENQLAYNPKPAIMKPEDEFFMQQAMKFLEEHFSDPDINIGDMAEATATSRSGLNRKMKSLLGVTPLDFIREARIRKACQMLESGCSVNDAAYSCGFSDPKYFGKCFKTEMGKTPSEYKKQHLE